MFADPEAVKTDGTTGKFYEYAICMLCAFFGAIWILLNAVLVESMPVFVNLFFQTIFGFFFLVIFCWVSVENYSLFSVDKKFGTMGMFHQD